MRLAGVWENAGWKPALPGQGAVYTAREICNGPKRKI